MNKTILLFLLILSTGGSLLFAQSGATDAFEIQNRIFKASLKNRDLQTATIAIYNMQALKPERTDLNDSLAWLYYNDGKYISAYFVANAIVTADPKRDDMLDIVADCKLNLGEIKGSLADYEKLYGNGKQVFYLYRIAQLQLKLARTGECLASLDQILASQDADKQKVSIPIDNGRAENGVPMKAAAYFMKAICAANQLNQMDVAKENLNKALQIYPDFVLAKSNLEALAKEAEKGPATKAPAGGAKTTTTAPVKPK
jgi:tetratricopeptide (TPR) repeat protein